MVEILPTKASAKFLDYVGLGLILMSIEVLGQRWIEDQPISAHQWVAGSVFMVAGAISIIAGTWWDKVTALPNSRISVSLDAVAHDARTWLAAAALIIFGVPVALWLVSPVVAPVPAISSDLITVAKTEQAAQDQMKISEAQKVAQGAMAAKETAEHNFDAANQQIGTLQSQLTTAQNALSDLSKSTSLAAPQRAPQEEEIQSANWKTSMIDQTPEYLMGLYKDRTDVQGRTEAALYIGRGIKYRGLVRNVYNSYHGYSVTSLLSDGISSVVMRFEGKNGDDVSAYGPDHSIYAQCQIDEVDRFVLQLSKCELIKN
jgi:hypothetical protein